MKKPLYGKRILVTRPVAQAENLMKAIAEQGGEPVLFPLLKIAPTDDACPLQQAISQLGDYAIAVFVSPNAVAYSLPFLLDQRSWPVALPAAAIGQATAAQLANWGIENVVLPAEGFDSESLLELPEFQSESLAGKKVLILRGNGGRELLAETLIERGAWADCVTCYHRSAPTEGAPVMSLLHDRQLDALTISSSEGLRNLLALLNDEGVERLRSTPVFVPHRRIAEVAAELGLRRVILTRPADAGIIEGLCEYNWHHSG